MGLVHPQDYVSCGKDRLHFRLITGRISMQQFQRLKRFIRNISEESLVLFLAGGVVEGHGGEAEEGRGGGGQWGVQMGQVELLRLLFIFRFSASRSVGFLGFLRFCRDSAKILEGKWLPTPPPYLPLPPTKSIRMIETSYL